MSERASKQMSKAERASEVSSAERENEFAVRANEQMAQYYMRQYPFIFTQYAWMKKALGENFITPTIFKPSDH